MNIKTAGQGSSPASVSATWSDDTWRRLEADLSRTLQSERLKRYQSERRAKLAAAQRQARTRAWAVSTRKKPRLLGARPAYWALLVAVAVAFALANAVPL